MMKVGIGGVAAVLGLLCATYAQAQSPHSVQASMHYNLAAAMTTKKQVTVVLKNGDKYQANAGSVCDHLVVLTQPAQKEFFDVLVPIEEITALEVRAR